jgi:hypothetical protein
MKMLYKHFQQRMKQVLMEEQFGLNFLDKQLVDIKVIQTILEKLPHYL